MCLKKEGEYIKNIFLIYFIYSPSMAHLYMDNYIYIYDTL